VVYSLLAVRVEKSTVVPADGPSLQARFSISRVGRGNLRIDNGELG